MKENLKREIELLREENKKLKEQLNEQHSNSNCSYSNSDAWDFHWDGHGDYEESRRCFYGDFS